MLGKRVRELNVRFFYQTTDSRLRLELDRLSENVMTFRHPVELTDLPKFKKMQLSLLVDGDWVDYPLSGLEVKNKMDLAKGCATEFRYHIAANKFEFERQLAGCHSRRHSPFREGTHVL